MAGTIRVLVLAMALSLAMSSLAQNSSKGRGKFWGLDGLDEVVHFDQLWQIIEGSTHIEGAETVDGDPRYASSIESRLMRFRESGEQARVVRVTSGNRTQERPDLLLDGLCGSFGRLFCAHLIIEDTRSAREREILVPQVPTFEVFSVPQSPPGREFQALRGESGIVDGWLIYDCWGLLVWSAPEDHYGVPLAKAILSTLASSCSNRRQAGMREPRRGTDMPADAASVEEAAPQPAVVEGERPILEELKGLVVSIRQPTRRIQFRDSWAGDPMQSRPRPRLLVFWATWCAPCVKELPDLLELKAQHGKEILFVGVSKDSYRDQQAVERSWTAIAKLINLDAWPTQYLSLDRELEQVLFPEETLGNGDLPLPAFALLDHQGGLQFTMVGALTAGNHRAELVSHLERAIARFKSSGGMDTTTSVDGDHR